MINKVILVGNLGKDPEARYTKDGKAVVTFSLATSEKWKDKTKVEWHKIVVFGKLAEICEKYLKKGKQVYIEGRLQTRSWDKDGQTHYMTEIIADQMRMLSDSTQDQRSQSTDGAQPQEEPPF